MILAHTLDGHGPERVLFLHDWLGDATEYDAAMTYLDPGVLTCARVDLPGYGESRAHPLRGVDAGALDAEVLAVADHLGWSRFHLVSHSMSTVIAQRLARAVPGRLASVTLTAPVTPGTRHPDAVVDSLRAMGRDPGRRREVFAARAGTRLSPRWLDLKMERWAARSEPAAVEAYVDLFARPDLPTTLADVQIPVLAITGADDAPPFTRPAVEAALRAVYPEVVVEVCVSAGHYPMQETPPLFAWMVERFVRGNPLVGG
jgi:pimeloyl-ACP methyl ester carboxylesterase